MTKENRKMQHNLQEQNTAIVKTTFQGQPWLTEERDACGV